MAGNADLHSMVLECALLPPVQRVDPGPIGRRIPLGPGCLNSARTSAMRPVRQRLLFRSELGLGLVLRMVRQVARVFQDGFAINPKRPRCGKWRGAIREALSDL